VDFNKQIYVVGITIIMTQPRATEYLTDLLT